MATNHPTAPLLTRSDVILLHTLTNLRCAEVSTKVNEHRARWQAAPAGSDEARQYHALYQADLRYANDLRALAAVIDGLLDNNTHDNFRLQGE